MFPIRAALAVPCNVPLLCTAVRRFRAEHRAVRCTVSSTQDTDHGSIQDSTNNVTELRPIRTVQDLHTTLLGFAHAAATPFTPRQASSPQEAGAAMRSPSSPTAAAEDTQAEQVVLDPAPARDCNSQYSPPTTAAEDPQTISSAASAAPSSKRHLLHRLLLHRREGRRRERRAAAQNTAGGHRFPPPPFTSGAVSGSRPAAPRVAHSASSVFTGDSWYRAFTLFSEAVQQHHVSPMAQHFNLLLCIAQQHALWGRMDDVEEFWAHLLSSVQRLRREKMRDKLRAERAVGRSAERVGRHRALPALKQPTTPSSCIIPPAPATAATALTRQLDELREMEQGLMPNTQTYELLIGGALARGAWCRALEYCGMRTRSGIAMTTDASVRQVLQVYILAEASGAVTHTTTSPLAGPSSTSASHRLRTDERGQVLRAAAQRQRSSNYAAQGDSAQESHWSTALDFFRSNLHRVSSMHTVWCMATLLSRAKQPAELLYVVRDDCQRLLQASIRTLAAHALTSIERATLLWTLKMLSDAACELGAWRTALQLLREAMELRRPLLSVHRASLRHLWGAPHPARETSVSLPGIAGGDAAGATPGLPLSRLTTRQLSSLDQIGSGIGDDDVPLDEVQLSQHVLKNTLHTLRRVRRYAHMIDVYRSSSCLPSAVVDLAAGAALEEEDDDSAVVWRSMWTPSAVGYVAQAALAVRDLDLLLELCGLTAHGVAVAKNDAAASLSIPAEVYNATLRLIQYNIVWERCEAEKAVVERSTGASAAKRCGAPQWDVLSQRVYRAYRHRALRALAEEASPFRSYLERVSHASSSGGDSHAVVASSTTVEGAEEVLDAPVLSSSHKPLVQLLAQSLQNSVDISPFTAALHHQALKYLQRLRHPDTLALALVMDILRSQALQHRSSDAEAQSLLAAVKQVLETILVEQRIEPIPLVSTSLHDSATRGVDGGSKLTPAQLTSLSTLTAAAVHMSFDVLARVQPLTLMTYIPACVDLAWLPSAAAPAQLQLAQQAVVQWADEEFKRNVSLFAEPHPVTVTHTKAATPGLAGIEGTPALPHDAMNTILVEIEVSGRSAVAHFVRLHTHLSSRRARISGATLPLVAGFSTAVVTASICAVLDTAAQLLMQLQRSKTGHSPTAAMSAFLAALRRAWTERSSPISGPPPLKVSTLHNAEMEVVVVTSLNAVVQQVGASTVGRWTMWGDCVDMLMAYINPPLSPTWRRETQTERAPGAVMQPGPLSQSRPDAWSLAEATHETMRVLHTFIRLCDKAESGFVERVTMDWLLLGANSTRSGSSSAGGGGLVCREREYKDETRHSEASTPVEHLRRSCEKAHEQLRRSPSAPHAPFSPLELESMQLLLGALTWACRRQAKPLVRRLYRTLAPWLDTLLRNAPPPSPPSLTNRAGSVGDGVASASAERETLQQQLSRLRETALAACMAVAQCLSSGTRVEVLRDWQLQLRALRQLTNQGSGGDVLSDFGGLRKAAALIDGVAAVAVKLQRTWRYLLVELALDTHRRFGEAHQRRSTSSSPSLQLPPAVLKHRKGVEDAAESFAAWCITELLPRLVVSCLRACVEHETRALVTAALHKVMEAVWDVDFAAFVWHVDFRAREGVDGDGARAQALARLRTRGYQALRTELSWPNPDCASPQLARHLHIWILFIAHGSPTRTAVMELCCDLVSLDVFHGVQRALTNAVAESRTFPGGPTPASASPLPLPFFLLFVHEVDTLTEAHVAECLTSSRHAGSAAAATATGNDASSPVAGLARMADGRTAMEHLTKPLVHYTPSVLRVVQQAAQRVLYLTLCEGAEEGQALGWAKDAAHGHSAPPLSVVAQTPRSTGFTVAGRADFSFALLLRRSLAWPGEPDAYRALLRVVEAAAHETLRESEAVVYVFRHMERLGRAAEGVAVWAREDETTSDTSVSSSSTAIVGTFLAFYMSSSTLRRASPVNEQVCLAALLACAANTRRGDAAVSLPSVDLLTLLTAFHHVVSDHLVTEWQQGRLSPHQSTVLTEWLLRLVWEGVPVSPIDAKTASLKRYGAVAVPAADGNTTVAASAAIPLRRASIQWLLVTRGTIVPTTPRDDGNDASQLPACDESLCSPQPLAAASAPAERIASLTAALDRSSERFASGLDAVLYSPIAAASPLRAALTSAPPRERPASEPSPDHPSASSPSSVANLVRNILQQLSTRHAVQQLLQRYRCANDALRPPVGVEDTEVDALVQALPESARDSAKVTLRRGARPLSSYKGESAREASMRVPRSHARLSARESFAPSDEGAVELESWVDAAVTTLTSMTVCLPPPPTPLPTLLRHPKQDAGGTWSALYTELLSVTESLGQCPAERPRGAARASDSRNSLDAYARGRAATLRPALLRVMANLSGASPHPTSVSPLASPRADGDVTPCVCSLLLISYVLVPLRSRHPPPSLVEVLTMVRRELWGLLLASSSASEAGICALHASAHDSRASYSALVQFCVRPVLLDALAQLHLSTSASSEAGVAAFEAVAYLLLLLHHISSEAAGIRVLSSAMGDTAAASASHTNMATDADAVGALLQTARELLHLAGQELFVLHISCSLSASSLASLSSSSQPLQTLYRRLARVWMQAGILLGDARSLLWGGQRLASWVLRRRQEVSRWIAEGKSAASSITAQSSEVAAGVTATAWLCVLPVAVLVAAACSPTRRSGTEINEELYSLAGVLPLPRDDSGAVAGDEYVSLCRHWQRLLQERVTEAASGDRDGRPQHWLSYQGSLAVILHGSVPSDVTPALVEVVRRQIGECLAGPGNSYPSPKLQQFTPVFSAPCPTASALSCSGRSDGGDNRGHPTIDAAAVRAAFQCVKDASEGDMRAFLRLEAARRAPVGEAVDRGKPKKEVTIQAAWRLIHRAALQERQRCGSGSPPAAPWLSLVPLATWREYVLNLHPVVPHTVHFIPTAVTEVLMLQSCATWSEGLSVLEHSLGTLHRSGATPVQQYMAQLLLERVRRTERYEEGCKTVGKEEECHFCSGLETYTYTVQQQKQPTKEEASGGKGLAFRRWRLWSQHMAQRSTHGTAALVCRVVDLLLVHHIQTTRSPVRDRSTRSPSVLAKHTLMEALRCGVHDLALTRVLFRLFWDEQYPCVEGAHAFLSALRAAKLARSDALALEAILTYLWVSDPKAAITPRAAEWTWRVLRIIDACEARATIPGSHAASSWSSSVSAWRHLKVAAEAAGGLQGPSHRFSVEAHRATWKSWAVLCRLQVVPKDVALCVVHLFKEYDRLTEVEELMVTTCYDMTVTQVVKCIDVGGRCGDTEEKEGSTVSSRETHDRCVS
ncbi:hypothetical protein GH5_06338 [Leishmania sp. Ghana 2012 LV757]|uniref:hypothetical protein n=1 Tax=Leishmania sp. Ghana 2012 LV757 TaxID=2803181 RepID=UPI001B5E2720|nr:hypothetical protein GH5_06338 [Leishmania sp. Ghana 2012 LV757]